MIDLNSLELFNQVYANESERSFALSLLNFFKTEIKKRLPPKAKILDIGSGSKSLFEEELGLDKSNITAVDFSSVAINKAQGHSEINYIEMDVTKAGCLESDSFDLVFDSHCLHCITDKGERQNAFKNIFNSLRPDGIVALEMMVNPSGKSVTLPGKYVVDARELEEEVLAYGFKIIYFMIVRDLVFENENSKCDLVRVICRK